MPGQWNVLERWLIDLGEERLGEMDRHGIAFAIRSTHLALQSVCDRVLAIDVARHPDRFAGFAALPMQDPEAACAELTRAVKTLGFKGAMVSGFSQVGDPDTIIYYDDPIYRPFWKTVADLGVPFYLHPRDPLANRTTFYDGHPWLRGASWAFGVETAERRFAEHLRSNFYVTTSGNFHTSTLECAIAEMGVDRVLFSVDYPFEECVDAAGWFDTSEISESDRLKIGRTNAAQLFQLLSVAT